MIREIKDIEEVYDFVRTLSYDDRTAAYPRIKDDASLKRVLQQSVDLETDKLLACYDYGEQLIGVAAYTKDYDGFMQTTILLAKGDYTPVYDEMIDYFRQDLKGYEYHLGFPKSNQKALDYFQARPHFECIEDSIVTHVKNFSTYSRKTDRELIQVTKDTFDDYGLFHDPIAKGFGMYYDAKNLLDNMDKFAVLALKEEDQYVASIFYLPHPTATTVFGLFLHDDYHSKDLEEILIDGMLDHLSGHLDVIDEIVYFIDPMDVNELKAAQKMGFETKEEYICYLVK